MAGYLANLNTSHVKVNLATIPPPASTTTI